MFDNNKVAIHGTTSIGADSLLAAAYLPTLHEYMSQPVESTYRTLVVGLWNKASSPPQDLFVTGSLVIGRESGNLEVHGNFTVSQIARNIYVIRYIHNMVSLILPPTDEIEQSFHKFMDLAAFDR